MLKWLLSCVAVIALLVSSQSPLLSGGKGSPIEGVWEEVETIADGKRVPDGKEKITFTLMGGKAVLKVDNTAVMEGDYKLDASKKPMHLDITISKGEGKGKVLAALVEVKGALMSFAISEDGARPKSILSTPGSKITVEKYKKAGK